MMKVGIYSRLSAHSTALAFAEGLHWLGHDGVQRSHSDYGPGQVEDFNLVVLVGLRGKGRRMLEDYSAHGVPVVVIDFGYVKRIMGDETLDDGHWQIGIGGLNKVPPFTCPADRWRKLGVTIAPPAHRVHGPTILCGQVPGDAAHPFANEEELFAWSNGIPYDEYRPHPQVARLNHFELEPLDAMLARAGRIVTWNSNVGHDALLAGVPVTAIGPAPYAAVQMHEREAYFHRVAYAQWTIEEMRRGEPQRFLIEHWLPYLDNKGMK